MGKNIIVVQGNIQSEPEFRFLSSGTLVGNFSIPTSADYKKAEEQFYPTTWLRISVFGNNAEFVQKHFHAGDAVMVTGRLEQQTYTTREGDEKTSLVVQAKMVDFAGSRKDNNERSATTNRGSTTAPAQEDDAFDAGDVPF